MKICIAGKSYIAVEALLYILEKYEYLDICVCPNKNDNSTNTWEPSLKKVAANRNVEILKVEELFKFEELIFISLEFDRIIDLKNFKSNNFFNIHFSSLPAYKGVYTSALPILNSEKGSGVTLHKIDQGIDTGEIIDTIDFNLEENETALSLYMKYNEYGFLLFKSNIDTLINGNYVSKEQIATGASYYSRKSIDYSRLTVDLNKTAYEINKQIRAYNFRAYQIPEIFEAKISHSKILKSKSLAKPGTLNKESKYSFTINTIDYDLILFKDRINSVIDFVKNDDVISLKHLEEDGYNLFEKFKNGWDLGIIAAYHGSWSILRYLINCGYSIFSKNVNGTNVLMYTIFSEKEEGKKDMIIELLNNGLKPTIKDFSGKSTFDWLEEYDRTDLIKYIETNEV